ncbi:hypothetical protein ARSEF4850_006188 [Beauveria asiatica]
MLYGINKGLNPPGHVLLLGMLYFTATIGEYS